MVRDIRHSRYVYEEEDHIDMAPLLRLAAWGGCAVIAIGGAALAGRSDLGTARAEAALAAFRASPLEFLSPSMAAAQPSEAERQAKQLAESVKALTADRDQLAARVATLEHSLSDLTGSIARDRAAAAPAATSVTAASNPPIANVSENANAPAAILDSTAAAPPAPVETASVAEETRPAEASPATIGTIVNVPAPRPGPLAAIQSYVTAASTSRSAPRLAAIVSTPAAETPAKSIAVELAVATNVNALRSRWGALKTAHPGVLDRFTPLISVRPSARPGFTEFHLVAGPVVDADAAARICAALSVAHVPCRTASYEGQSLELR